MRNIVISLALIACSISGYSQQEQAVKTLFTDDINLSGWFVELPFTSAKINGESTLLPGVSAGIILNNKIRLGLSGADYSHKFNKIYLKDADSGKGGYLEGNEGGLFIEPVIGNQKLIHLTFPLVIGGGRAEIQSKALYPDEDNEMDEKELGEQSYFLFKPSAQVEINLHKYIRLAAGVGYRFTSENKIEGLDDQAFSGLSSQLSIKIGKF